MPQTSTLLSVLLHLCLAATAYAIPIGAAKLDITPDYPTLLAGYGSRTTPSEGVDERLWARALAMGKANPVESRPPGPEDVCCIMYTSGTSGTPKGVVLHHRAIVSGVASAHDLIAQAKLGISERDSLLSYMPLAHIFDRLLEEFALSVGARIGWY